MRRSAWQGRRGALGARGRSDGSSALSSQKCKFTDGTTRRASSASVASLAAADPVPSFILTRSCPAGKTKVRQISRCGTFLRFEREYCKTHRSLGGSRYWCNAVKTVSPPTGKHWTACSGGPRFAVRQSLSLHRLRGSAMSHHS